MRTLAKLVLTGALATAGASTAWMSDGAAQAPAPRPQPQAQVVGGRGGPPPIPRKRVLLLAPVSGWYHGSTSGALATMYQLLTNSGFFEAEIKTDTKWITKRPDAIVGDAHNLDGFDVIMAINPVGTWDLDEQQKKDFLSFIHDDGKGFVGAHAALDANHQWPEYLEMIGGEFVAHPWMTFAAPVIIEDQTFPAMRHFAATQFTYYDEMYMTKGPWSRDKVNVLMRLDESKLPPPPARPAGPLPPGMTPAQAAAAAARASLREDRDFAIAWAKTYGKGRVFYSSLGHVREAWNDPEVQKMYFEAVKWAAGLTEGSTASHPRTRPGAATR